MDGAAVGYRLDPWWWLVAGVAGLLLILVVSEPDPYLDILLFVRDGLVVTIILTLCSFVFIIVVGLLGGLGRISKNRVVYLIASLYVEVVRGIPLLVQLIWWYFAAPVVIQAIGSALNIEALAQYRANAIFLAIVGLVICYGAYMSEIFRAGILSIHRGQMEAARSLGMTYFQAMRHVVLPQAMRVVSAARGQRVHHAAEGHVSRQRSRGGRPNAAGTRVHGGPLQSHRGVDAHRPAVPRADPLFGQTDRVAGEEEGGG